MSAIMRKIDGSSYGGATLTRQEIIDHEHDVKDAVSKYLNFTSYSLFFPRSTDPDAEPPEPEYRGEDRELLLPLVQGGRMLAYFVVRDVTVQAPSVAPKYLAGIANAALEIIALRKHCVTDRLTGLFNREHFLSVLTRAVDRVKGCLVPGAGGLAACENTDTEMPTFSGNLGVLFLDLDRFQTVNDRYGYPFGDRIVAEVGRCLAEVCPGFAAASRYGNDKFAVLLPDANRRACFQLAEVIRESVEKLHFDDPVSGDRVRVSLSIGYASYPQALDGRQYGLDASEQGRIVLRKARRAAAVAKDMGRNRVFGYRDILEKGGRVLETLPLDRMAVSLGTTVGARVGQRFLIRSTISGRPADAALTADERISGRYPSMYKAEAVIVDAQEDIAFAEVLHLADAAWPVEPGDRLVLVTEQQSIFDTAGGTETRDEESGLLEFRAFMGRFEEYRGEGAFGLCIVKILSEPPESVASYRAHMESMTRHAATVARDVLGTEAVGGNYGLGGLIFLVPDVSDEALRTACAEIATRCESKLAVDVCAAGAVHPCLDFQPGETLANVRDALDHALLLPAPRVAVFDSVTLNLTGDRMWADGDVYGALDRYRMALELESGNSTARNSLAICYAHLGKLEEAREEFSTVLEREPDDVMALYNLGRVLHRMGRLEEARVAYDRCLAQEPEHIFSLVRLGNLSEREGNLDEAERLYLKASTLRGGETLAYRPLARTAWKRGDLEQAREYLHLALNANHNDAHAMYMLALLYMEGGEDPQIAEVLARQSAALRPERGDYLGVLVRALRAQGKDAEADQVAGRIPEA
ncbi:diguanylate cyclase domain-containing protein [Desulfovibrio oxyclinae]|uniref:diguanylate cyclase domain-containing protein n=1 Tax=Desulfovibrio oxyclinae TaxID=63560 RepID=UPI000375D954|nr:diguanylate cyclase [Desulfovibrio oxyclinae]